MSIQKKDAEDGGVMKTKEELYYEQIYRDTKNGGRALFDDAVT